MKYFLSLLFFICCGTAHAQWASGQNADYVLAQPDFTTNAWNYTATTFQGPNNVAIDVTNHKLYVADQSNNRVLRFAYPITSNQPTAERVFGQANMTDHSQNRGGGVTANSLKSPSGLFVYNGDLWVCDTYNNRIVRYSSAYNSAIDGPNADRVIGQANFTSGSAATSQSGLYYPMDVTIDASGNLWVADFFNNRVLKYNTMISLTDGQAAIMVLGQTDFLTSTSGASATTLYKPKGIVTSGTTVWVSDNWNNRVLRYSNPSTNGAAASGVLGQTNFTGVNQANPPTVSSIWSPEGIALDNSGRLFVSGSDRRVLIFNNAAAKTDGAAADIVLGKSTFVSSADELSQNATRTTTDVAIDDANGKAIIVDKGNQRVLVFSGYLKPASQPTNLLLTSTKNLSNNDIVVNFAVSATATNYLVVRSTGASAPTFVPSDGTSYTVGAQGSDQIISVGTSNSVTDATVTSGTTYNYKVYAFNGSGTFSTYLTISPLSGSTVLNAAGSGSIGSGSSSVGSNYPSQGVDITFPAGSTGTNLTVLKTNSVPASNFAALPGVRGVSNVYFTISSSNATPGTYTLVLDFSALGLTQANWNKFVIMKRENSAAAWQNITAFGGTIANRQTDGVWGKFTITGLSSFSQFAGGIEAVTWTVTSNAETGANTLKQAITDAAAGDIVTFNTAMTITLTSPIVVSKDLTIRGLNGGVVLNGNNASRVMDISDVKVVRLEKLKIVNGYDDVAYAGGIWNNGDLTMVNCVVSGNTETQGTAAGGILQYSDVDALQNTADVLNLVNCTITKNEGTDVLMDDGAGGIDIITGTVNIYNTIIYGNTGTGYTDVYPLPLTKVYNSCIGNLDSLTVTAGSGNISSNPLFTGSAQHPYTISVGSPSADAGDNSYCFETTDIKGDVRKLSKLNAGNAGTIDMGAYEYSTANPLPVELTTFTASAVKNGVTLNWKTATETNNYGFEIERTTTIGHPEQANAPIYDPVGKGDWFKIGFVEGNGTTNAPKSYSFVDKSASGKTSYRLKQIDRDGKFEYSQTVEVTALSAPKEFGLEQNYPNPFNPTTAISYQLSANGFTTLKIYDAIGREVATLVNEVKEAGSYSAQFDGARFSSGVYFARLSSDGKSQMRKLLLMK